MLLTKELYQHYNICADKQTGGGSGMKKKLEDLILTNAVVLAIVDSDKMYPKKTTYGSTAKSSLSVYNNSLPNIKLYVTDTHEAENLIPLEYVVTHCSKKYKGKDFIQKLKRKNALHYLKHYDYKDGIKYEAVADNDEYYKFAKEIYEVLYSTDFDKHVQATHRKPKDKQYVFPPINSSILEKYVSAKINSINIQLDDNYAFADCNKQYRETLCKLICAFTCVRDSEPIH